jgi:hypothetical protein
MGSLTGHGQARWAHNPAQVLKVTASSALCISVLLGVCLAHLVSHRHQRVEVHTHAYAVSHPACLHTKSSGTQLSAHSWHTMQHERATCQLLVLYLMQGMCYQQFSRHGLGLALACAAAAVLFAKLPCQLQGYGCWAHSPFGGPEAAGRSSVLGCAACSARHAHIAYTISTCWCTLKPNKAAGLAAAGLCICHSCH